MRILGSGVLSALAALLVHAVLVALRLFPATLALPFFGGRSLPAQSRVPVLLVLALGVMPSLFNVPANVSLTPWIAVAAARELAVGTALALVLGAPFFALEQGGRVLDAARGANAAEVIAPDSGVRSSPLSELARWTFGVIFLAAGGLRATLRVVAGSFELLPLDPSGRASLDTARLLEGAARWSAVALSSSVTLLSSGLMALAAAETALGIAGRLSPPIAQSNAALPLRALLPLAALALTVGLWTGAAQELARSALSAAGALVR